MDLLTLFTRPPLLTVIPTSYSSLRNCARLDDDDVREHELILNLQQ